MKRGEGRREEGKRGDEEKGGENEGEEELLVHVQRLHLISGSTCGGSSIGSSSGVPAASSSSSSAAAARGRRVSGAPKSGSEVRGEGGGVFSTDKPPFLWIPRGDNVSIVSRPDCNAATIAPVSASAASVVVSASASAIIIIANLAIVASFAALALVDSAHSSFFRIIFRARDSRHAPLVCP